MTSRKHFKIWFLFLITNTIIIIPVVAQQQIHTEPSTLINKFLHATGGDDWENLKTRKEYAYVEYEEDKKAVVPNKSHDRIKLYAKQGMSLEVHQMLGSFRSILVFKPKCNWYYSDRSQTVKFFGPEPVKSTDRFVRSEVMEVLNLEPLRTAYVEDTLYRVDFKDIRQLHGKQSLFFGMNTGLIYKRSYISKNGVRWQYQFSNYTRSENFVEPYLITLSCNDQIFMTVTTKSVSYNVDIDYSIFAPPVPCKNQDSFIRLEFPYRPTIE